MNSSRSIKQNARPDTLPNFRNLGVVLRILLISNGLAILLAMLLANGWADVVEHIMQIATLLTPVLLTGLMMLWLAQPWLSRLSYRKGVIATMSLVVVLTLSIYNLGGELYSLAGSSSYFFNEARYVLLGVMVCGILLLYFRLRSKMLSRSLHEARLQVLRARIRPHFLFNTINAVLGILRAQPKKAETALEDMADLFRMAMSDVKDLVLLRKEIQLSKQYISLEQLRMGERLDVNWQLRDIPNDALIPPLLLQPLLENAVYHGIELLPQGGRINIMLHRTGDEMRLTVENPYSDPRTSAKRKHGADDTQSVYELEKSIPQNIGKMQHPSNKMALQNIRERLDLLFDAEARYQVENGNNFYRVEIVFPYVKDSSA